MVMPVNVAPNPQSERAQTTETPCSEPKTRFGEYPGPSDQISNNKPCVWKAINGLRLMSCRFQYPQG